jgi:hypothetical protein
MSSIGRLRRVTFTPTLTAGAYSANDVLFETVALVGALPYGGRGRVVSINVHDADDQGQDMVLFFLRSNVALGTLNAPITITDANAKFITGAVEIESWLDLVNSQFGIGESSVGTAHQGLGSAGYISVEAVDGGTTIYCAGMTLGTPTHTVAGLTFDVWFESDLGA